MMTTRRTPQRQGRQSGPGGLPDWLITALVILISVVWAVNFLLGALNPHYNSPAEVNAVFPTVIGAILINTATRRRSEGKEDDETEEP